MFFTLSNITKEEAAKLRLAIVASTHNKVQVDLVLQRVQQVLDDEHIAKHTLEIMRVPGDHEIAYGAYMLASTEEFDCIIALGVLSQSEANSPEVTLASISKSFDDIGLRTEVPVVNGVLMVKDLAEMEQLVNGPMKCGDEFAHAALTMAHVKRELWQRLDTMEMEIQVQLDEAEDNSDEDEGNSGDEFPEDDLKKD